jgi:hypothetical protein
LKSRGSTRNADEDAGMLVILPMTRDSLVIRLSIIGKGALKIQQGGLANSTCHVANNYVTTVFANVGDATCP